LRKALQSADLADGGLDDNEGLCVEWKTGIFELKMCHTQLKNHSPLSRHGRCIEKAQAMSII